MNEMVSVPQIPQKPEMPVERVLFTGKRDDFRKLVTRGGLLEFVTLGFYRFWLATDMRRHLWSHTVVEGDAPEYTGRARELLIGFLVAMAILIPVYLVYFLLGLEAERYRTFASGPLVAFIYLFGQFAIYRARRYRMTRTVWRGVRFWMTGSGWAYAFRAGAWGLLVLLTLGLALPWRDAALERYKMRHSYYGGAQGRFEGRGGEFFKRAWWLWLIAILFLAVIISLPFVFFFRAPTGRFGSNVASSEAFIWVGVGLTISFVLAVIVTPLLYGAFKSIQWRWWIEGLRFGDVAAQSSLRRRALIGLYWKVIGWSALFTAIFSVLLTGVDLMSRFGMGGGRVAGGSANSLINNPVMAGAGIAGYLVTIVAINVVIRLYLVRDIWARVAGSVTLTGLDSVREVAAKGELASALGEGFADGLDVGGF